MSTALIFFFILILVPRLANLVMDDTSKKRILWISISHAVLVILVFKFNASVIAALATITVCAMSGVFLKHKITYSKGYQLLSLISLMLIPTYISSYYPLEFTNSFVAVASHLSEHIAALPDSSTSLRFKLLVLTGLLILANETNIGIRAVISHLKLEPAIKSDSKSDSPTNTPAEDSTKTSTTDQKEYNAGRVIGILERWLMFLIVVFTNDIGALAFIIAAKGLARIKQLEDKDFAEYMIIGTLLSTLSAILVAFWVKSFI